jgi:serine/threonine protein kinase
VNALFKDLRLFIVAPVADNKNYVKLADFGLAKILEDSSAHAQSEVGTPYYSALEMISHQPYSFPADVWSMGIILYEMMQLEVPYAGESGEPVRKRLYLSVLIRVNLQRWTLLHP